MHCSQDKVASIKEKKQQSIIVGCVPLAFLVPMGLHNPLSDADPLPWRQIPERQIPLRDTPPDLDPRYRPRSPGERSDRRV